MRIAILFLVLFTVVPSSYLIAEIDFAPQVPDARQVSYISEDTVVINWQTKQPCETKLQLRKGTFPVNTPGYEDVWKDTEVVKGAEGNRTEHLIVLDHLDPKTKYYYRLNDPSADPPRESTKEAALMWGAEPPWSREYAFITKARPGEKAFVRIPVKVLITPNVIDFSTLTPDSTLPVKAPDSDIKMYEDELQRSVLFYWVNSHMMYWIDLEFFVEPEWQRVGDETADLPDFYKDWPAARPMLRIFDSADITNHQAKWPLKEKKIYTGQVIIRCTRRWNPAKKEWFYQPSGGGTFGVGWMHWPGDRSQQPVPGRTQFLGGSDISWLMTHEFKHQVESQHRFSGLDQEYDRCIFCHYAPRFNAPMGQFWRWDTSYDHGRHYDGIAYQLRVMTENQFLRNMFGHVEVAKDADNDGVPDSDPRLPLDEARFGSDPKKLSTDGTGVTDLEKIMFAKWVPAQNQPSRGKVFSDAYSVMWELSCLGNTDRGLSYKENYACPSARSSDSDGDHIKDIDDPYPLYPWRPNAPLSTITIDGKTDDWKDIEPVGQLRSHGLKASAKVAYDKDYLYYLFETEGPLEKIILAIDADADGSIVGNENLQITLSTEMTANDPGEGSAVPRNAELKPDGRLILRDVAVHMTSDRQWPHWDNGQPFKRAVTRGGEEWIFQVPKRYGDWHEIKYISTSGEGKRTVELAIPNGTGTTPIQAGPGHTIAHEIQLILPGNKPISIYEPQTLFKMTMEMPEPDKQE